MDIDTVLQHYLIAALWADMPEDDDEGTPDDIHPDSVADAKREILAFMELAGDLIAQYEACEFGSLVSAPAAEQLGHDIWLTRNGHGCGFWDRDNLPGTLGDELSEIARAIGSRDIYRGDDEEIYIA